MDEQNKINALCVRALFTRARKGAMLAPLATLFMGWMVLGWVELPLIIGWMILNSIPDLANFILTSRLLKVPPPDEHMAFHHRWQFMIRTLQGVLWGSAALMFHVQGEQAFINDLGILVVLITVSAISMINSAPSFRSLLGFSSGILLLPAAYYFWLGDSQHVLFGFGLLMLWLVELETGRDVFRQFVSGVRWGVANQEMSLQLEERNRQLDELNQHFRSVAIHDELTGLYNRYFITRQLVQHLELFVRYATDCTLILVDIDHFKNVNDSFGHAVGDKVLVAFSRQIENQLRQGDIFARYGGEEFILVLPLTDVEAALQLANRILRSISSVQLLEDPVSLGVTASFGVAQLKKDETVDDWLRNADQALYRAKQNGRNCVMH
jgi:diguanylate cyclase (GGDEF)-like protein